VSGPPIDPLIRDLSRGHRPADRWDDGRWARREAGLRPHLTNWICFGNRRTSISPSR